MNQILATTKFTDQDLQNKLKDLAQKTDIIIIIQKRESDTPQIEFKGKDVKEFFSLLKLKIPEKLYYCRCLGSLAIGFYSRKKRIGGLSYHHSKSIRATFVPIHSNINIVKEYQEKLKTFLLKHGVKAAKLK